MMEIFNDEYYMNLAIKEAQFALEKGEVPVGAIAVSQNQIIAKTHNLTEQLTDVTAHAEILAITSAAEYLGTKYLHEVTLYITLEPCVMCAGALNWAQIGRIVFGASDEKKGFRRFDNRLLHPKTIVDFGIAAEKCSYLMTSFFKNKRDKLS